VKKQLEEEYKSESRLFAIDAGLDAQLLREKYSDRSRFIITNGMVRPSYNYGKENSEVYGIVTDISVNSIHVPLDKRIVFDVILFHDKIDSREPKLPRFTVELAYGSRYEPWILKVHMIEEKL